MLNNKLIAKSFRSLMTMMIFAGVVAMCGSFIDGVVTGNFLGADKMASFGYASPVFMIIAAIAGIFANGGKALCSVYLGEGSYDKARKNFSLSILSTVIFGIIIMVVCLFCAESIASVLGASGEYVFETAQYIRGLGIGAVPIMLMQVLTSYLSLDNAEILSFLGAIVMTIVNISLDFMVGLVWHGGLFEMALATSASYLAATLAMLIYFLRKDKLFCFTKPELSFKELGSITNTGLPSAVSRVSFSVACVLINWMLSACAGEIAVTAVSVQSTISNFISAIFMGVTSTISVFSGIYYGERNKPALKISFVTACKYGLIMSVAIAVVVLAAAPFLAGLILQADELTLSIASDSLRFYAVSLPTEMLSLILMYHYLSTEKLALSHIVCVFHNFVLLVVPAFLLEKVLGLNGIWLGWLMSGILLIPIMIPLLRKYKGGTQLEKWMALSKDFEPKDRKVFEVSITDNMEDVMKVVADIKTFCMDSGIEQIQSSRISLAVEEMVGNIVQHGFKRKSGNFIDIRLVVSGDGGCLSIRDNGIKFNPLSYKNSQEQYGIRIIRGISKGMDYRYAVSMNNLNIFI
jgi:Na+-driven multidrug efflux pump